MSGPINPGRRHEPGPLPPVPPPPPAAPPPAAPPRRVSAVHRAASAATPSSPYAAAAPQPARPMGWGLPLQQVPPPGATPVEGDWFGAAASRTAAPAAVPPEHHAPGGGATSRGSRRRSPATLLTYGLAAVLLVIAVVFAWSRLSGPPEAGDHVAGGDAATGGASADPTGAPQTLAAFASPSGNIMCEITTADVTCSIATLNQQPAPVDTCDGTVGYRVTITGGTGDVALPCVPSSRQPQPARADLPRIPYGQSVTEGPYTCASDETGMHCTDEKSGKGFSIAKAGIVPS